MRFQNMIRLATLAIVMLAPLLLVMGCSTVHVHREFLFKGAEGGAVKHELHKEQLTYYPTTYYDEVTLTLEGAKIQLALVPGEFYGTTFVGPLLVPFFPIFWGDHKLSYAVIDINLESAPGNELDIQSDNVTVSFDDSSFLKPTKIDSKSQIFYEGKNVKHLVFDFERMPYPQRIKVLLDGMKLNGVTQKPISVTYTRGSYWHYVPFVFMHTD